MPELNGTAITDPAKVAECWEANADTWTRHARAGYDIYRDALNTPAFLAMLPPIGGLTGLDIGCGEASNTRQLAGLGAKMYAVDTRAPRKQPILSAFCFASRTEQACHSLRKAAISLWLSCR